ncbi:hypothetical protein [Kibdelosporangium philippinense]
MAEAGGGQGRLTCEYVRLAGRVGAGTGRRGRGAGIARRSGV